METDTATKHLFAILDAFNRDKLYRQCNVELKFSHLADGFCGLLRDIPQCLADKELEFDDYKDTIPYVHTVPDPADVEFLKQNTNKSASIKSSLLFFAASQPIPASAEERNSLMNMIRYLIESCPAMVKYQVQGKNDPKRSGPTPIHVMIVKEANTKEEKEYKRCILKQMLGALKNPDNNDAVLGVPEITGELASGSVMRGRSILNVAARTLDLVTIKMLLKREKIDACNSNKDNIYHTLIRYATFNPDKEQAVQKTMKGISDFLDTNPKVQCSRVHWAGFPQRLWNMKNKEGLTPLQLSAKLGRIELFDFISKRKVIQYYLYVQRRKYVTFTTYSDIPHGNKLTNKRNTVGDSTIIHH